MPTFQVELEDGKTYEIDADREPTHEEIMSALGYGAAPELPPAEGPLMSAFRSFASGIIPATTTAAGAAVGAAGGAVVTPEAAGVGAIPGAIAGGTAGGFIGKRFQHWLMGDKWFRENELQLQANAQTNPVSAGAGEIIPTLVSMAGGGGPSAQLLGIGERAVVAAGVKAGTAEAEQIAAAAIQKATSGMSPSAIALRYSDNAIAAARMESSGVAQRQSEGEDLGIGDYIDAMAHGAFQFGPLGVLPHAETLAKALGYSIPQAALATLSGAIYDSVVHGKEFDPEEIAKKTGADIIPFALFNAVSHGIQSVHTRTNKGAQLDSAPPAPGEAPPREMLTPIPEPPPEELPPPDLTRAAAVAESDPLAQMAAGAAEQAAAADSPAVAAVMAEIAEQKKDDTFVEILTPKPDENQQQQAKDVLPQAPAGVGEARPAGEGTPEGGAGSEIAQTRPEAEVAIPPAHVQWIADHITELTKTVTPEQRAAIADSAANRKTTKETAADLGMDFDVVRAVKTQDQIPSWTNATTMSGALVEAPEFTEWLSKRQKPTTPESNAPHPRTEQESETGQLPRTEARPAVPPDGGPPRQEGGGGSNDRGGTQGGQEEAPLTFEQFEKDYRATFKKWMSYTPDQVGSRDYAEIISKMADEHPDWVHQIEATEPTSKPEGRKEPTNEEERPKGKTPEGKGRQGRHGEEVLQVAPGEAGGEKPPAELPTLTRPAQRVRNEARKSGKTKQTMFLTPEDIDALKAHGLQVTIGKDGKPIIHYTDELRAADLKRKLERPRVARRQSEESALFQASHPIFTMMNSIGGLMSKSKAKARGAEFWERNKSDWDDAPTLSHPTHNAIYSKGGGIMPSDMARDLMAEGVGDGTVQTMWDIIRKESAGAVKQAKGERESRANLVASEKKAGEEGAQQKEAFDAETGKEKGKVPVDVWSVKEGDTVWVDGEPMQVHDTDGGDIILEDGSRFGTQILDTSEQIYVEKVDKVPTEDEPWHHPDYNPATGKIETKPETPPSLIPPEGDTLATQLPEEGNPIIPQSDMPFNLVSETPAEKTAREAKQLAAENQRKATEKAAADAEMEAQQGKLFEGKEPPPGIKPFASIKSQGPMMRGITVDPGHADVAIDRLPQEVKELVKAARDRGDLIVTDKANLEKDVPGLTPEEIKFVRDNDAEGFYRGGKMVVVTDSIGVTKADGSGMRALARVINHELFHDIFRTVVDHDPLLKEQWDDLVHRIPESDLHDLTDRYQYLSDWQVNAESKQKLVEEWGAEKWREYQAGRMTEAERTLFEKFLDLVKKVWKHVMGGFNNSKTTDADLQAYFDSITKARGKSSERTGGLKATLPEKQTEDEQNAKRNADRERFIADHPITGWSGATPEQRGGLMRGFISLYFGRRLNILPESGLGGGVKEPRQVREESGGDAGRGIRDSSTGLRLGFRVDKTTARTLRVSASPSGEITLHTEPGDKLDPLTSLDNPHDVQRELMSSAEEEITHLADVLALRGDWRKEGSVGSFNTFTENRSRSLIDDVLAARESARASDNLNAADSINEAIVASDRLYRNASTEGSDPEVLSRIENLKGINAHSFASELVRQLVQANRDGRMREDALVVLRPTMKRWLVPLLRALKRITSTAREGGMGDVLKSRIADTERMLAEIEKPSGAGESGIRASLKPRPESREEQDRMILRGELTPAANELVNIRRKQFGWDTFEAPDTQEEQTVLDTVLRKWERNQDYPKSVVDRLENSGQAPTTEDVAAIIVRARDLENQIARVEDVLHDKSTDVAEKASANLRNITLGEELDRTQRVMNLIGQEQARAFKMRQNLMAADYSMGGMVKKAVAAKGGEDLTEAEHGRIESLSKQLRDLQKKHDDIQDKLDKAPSQAAFDDLKKQLEEHKSAGKKHDIEAYKKNQESPIKDEGWYERAIEGFTGKAREIAESLGDKLRRMDFIQQRIDQIKSASKAKDISPSLKAIPEDFTKGMTLEQLEAELGRLHESAKSDLLELDRIQRAKTSSPPKSKTKLTDFTNKDLLDAAERERLRSTMRDLKNEPSPPPEEQFADIRKILKEHAKSPMLEAEFKRRLAEHGVSDDAAAKMFAHSQRTDQEVPHKVLEGLMRSFIGEGDDDVHSIAGKISDWLKERGVNWSKEDVMRGISKYGQATRPSQEYVKKKGREIRGEMLVLSQIETIRNELRNPDLTGPQRDVQHQKLRDLVKERNALMAKYGVVSRSAQSQFKGAKDRMIRTLENRLTDLMKELHGEGIKKPERPKPDLGDRGMELQKQVQEIGDYLKDLRGTPDLTPEVWNERQRKAVQSIIDRMSDQMTSKDFVAKEKAGFPESPELRDLKKSRDTLREAFEQMRDADPAYQKKQSELKSLNLTRAMKRALDYWQDRIDNKKYVLPTPEEKVLTAEQKGVQIEIERKKKEFDKMKRGWEMANRTGMEKAQDWAVKLKRMFVLSSPISVAKLTAAALSRVGNMSIEDLMGKPLQRILPGAFHKGVLEGGSSMDMIAKAMSEAVSMSGKDIRDIWHGGQSDLDVQFSKKGGYDDDWSGFFGRIHAILKQPVKRMAFQLAMEKQIRAGEIEAPGSSTDPAVLARYGVKAYEWANRQIFMQDNAISKWWNAGLGTLERNNAKELATLGRVLLPIVKVPTNIVGEAFTYVGGVPMALKNIFKAYHAGIENLTPEQADLIQRQIKKGSLGLGLLALGYFNPQIAGGYYAQGQKRREDEAQFGGFRIGNFNVPTWMTHTPFFEAIQFGSSVRRVADEKLTKHGEARGLTAGAIGAALGLLEETPFVNEMMHFSSIGEKGGVEKFVGELAKSSVVPAAVDFIARKSDLKNPEGISPTEHPLDYLNLPTVKRETPTVASTIASGVPGLRQKLDMKVTGAFPQDQPVPEKIQAYASTGAPMPSAPQKATLEAKNGPIPADRWERYVEVRGQIIQKEMLASMWELRRANEEEQHRIIGRISNKATTAAKERLRLK